MGVYSGKEVLYLDPEHCNPIEGIPAEECAEMLQLLLKHLMQDKYGFTLEYNEHDMVLWDNLSMVHSST